MHWLVTAACGCGINTKSKEAAGETSVKNILINTVQGFTKIETFKELKAGNK